ncbi:hypothetical protein AAC03nite_03510 [Alicyclobacillus acidoterrestris]|uniref:DUF1450 domain-containing protein n=1 Tax=Alicyclobacillus suci TaxID=2816080 RepID=UPI0011936A58|nr:DUF1450 domain-containing protein [Alicyclobacillus suci]GEO24566.1 hypothetical protein AAC03nite_03510 [Alicyclobacillus acidoterrestris]
MRVEWCVHNEKLGVRKTIEEVKHWLQSQEAATANPPVVEFERYACVEDCAQCVRQPFVLVNQRESLTAPSGEELTTLLLNRFRDQHKP